jgi:BMFP domain-containing protein YqiC
MLKSEHLDDLANKLTNALPSAFGELKADMEKTFRSILQQTFAKLDLVTREEFDVQAEVLAQTRLKLEKLMKEVEALEK